MPSPPANPTQLPGRTSASGHGGGHGGGRGRWRVGWCLLAALGLHAALGIGLLLRAQALVPGASASAPGNPTRAAVHTLQVRWTPPARGPYRAGEAGAMRDERGERGEIDSLMQTPEPQPATVAAHGPADLPASSEGALAARGDEGAGGGSGRTTETPTEAPFTGYARRDMLDRPPQALGIVQITYPPGVEPGRVRTGRLTLFIDEAGAVRKVMVWPPTDPQDALPPPFVQAAREAFLQARFAPGERHGLPVKSRIDIEVSFDGRETTPLETAQQPQDAVGVDRSV